MSAELLWLLAPPALLGLALARLLGLTPAGDRWAFWAWSWLLGALGTALVTFVWLHTPLAVGTVWPLDAAVLGLALAAAWWGRRAPPVAPAPAAAAPRWERIVFALALGLGLVVTLQRMLEGDRVPIFEDDEAHVWALKAKLIFHSGGFTPAFDAALADEHFVYHRDYPLLIPLLHLWTFAHCGEITHVLNRVPIQLFALALVPALGSALARVVRPAAAAALVWVVIATAEAARQGRTAHADLALALGLVVALDGWLRWRSDGQPAWWRLSCAGAGLVVFAKTEGLLLVVACLCGLVAARLVRGGPLERPMGSGDARASRAARGWLALPLGLVLLTWCFNAYHGFANDVAVGDQRDQGFVGLLLSQAGPRLGTVLAWSWENLLLSRPWSGHLPWLALGLMVVLAPRLRRDALAIPALAVLAAYSGHLLVFLGTPHEIEWHLSTAAGRVSWQVAPALALWIGAVAGRFLPGFGRAAP